MKAEGQPTIATGRARLALPAGAWLAPLVVAALSLPLVFTTSYARHLLVLICIYVALTVSYNMIVGFTGYLTLAHNTFFGIGAYTSAIATTTYDLHFAAGILLGIVVTGVLSALFGWLLFTRLQGFTFSIVTLGLAITTYIVVLNWVDVTRGPMGIPGVPRPSVTLGETVYRLVQPLHFYYVGLVLVALVILVSTWIVRSRVGRALLSIRENERLAQASGVDALRYKLFVFVVASMLASVAGSYYVHYISVATYEIFWTFWITGLLAMLIVGGPGRNIAGVIIGTVLLVVLPEALRVAEGSRELIYGVALLLIIIFVPQGIGGRIETEIYKRRLEKWRSSLSQE